MQASGSTKVVAGNDNGVPVSWKKRMRVERVILFFVVLILDRFYDRPMR